MATWASSSATTSSWRCRYSGETDELLRLLETIRRLGARLIAMTGNLSSTLGQAADVALDCRVARKRAR